MDKEAKIRLSIDGAQGVVATLRQVGGEFTKLEIGAKDISGTLKGIVTGFGRLAVDVAKAANDLRAIDFGAAADRFKAVDDQITRMAIRGGKDIDSLRTKFRDFGRQAGAGTSEFASAVRQFDRNTFSGLDEGAEAMRTLGVYAEDTDRSLGEMVEFGSELWTKLGVPAQRFEGELRKIKTIAGDMGLASGFLGLENSLRRLMPLAANFQGGGTRAVSTVAAIQSMGYSKEVAESSYGRIFGALAGEGTHLLRQAAKDAGYKGEVVAQDAATGRSVVTRGALRAIQKYVKKKPFYGTAQYFGGGLEGETAARIFTQLDFDRVDLAEDRAQLGEDLRDRQEEEARAAAQHRAARSRDPRDLSGAAGLFGGRGPGGQSRFSGTAAGRRSRAALDDAAVESAAGRRVTEAQDRLRSQTTATERAVIGTGINYLPSSMQGAAQVGVAAASALAEHPFDASQRRAGQALPPGAIRGAVADGVKDGLKEAGPLQVAPSAPGGMPPLQAPAARIN